LYPFASHSSVKRFSFSRNVCDILFSLLLMGGTYRLISVFAHSVSGNSKSSNQIYIKCFAIAVVARMIQQILNQMIVGRVLMVDVIIKARLDARAKRYIHHHCLSKMRPGTIIEILVMKAQASMAFTLVQ